jgi:hypothetical protein
MVRKLASASGSWLLLVKSMHSKYFAALLIELLVGTQLFGAEGDFPQGVKVSITETSIKIGDIELRSGPPQGKYRYISLAAAEKALGPATDRYSPGRVLVYARPNLGIHLQEGMRGAEEGKIFKFHVYFEDEYDARSEKNSGKFNGQVRVDGLDIGPATAFESIRNELKKKGYKITEQPELSYAKKSGPWGQILIFKSGTSGKISRVEVEPRLTHAMQTTAGRRAILMTMDFKR